MDPTEPSGSDNAASCPEWLLRVFRREFAAVSQSYQDIVPHAGQPMFFVQDAAAGVFWHFQTVDQATLRERAERFRKWVADQHRENRLVRQAMGSGLNLVVPLLASLYLDEPESSAEDALCFMSLHPHPIEGSVYQRVLQQMEAVHSTAPGEHGGVEVWRTPEPGLQTFRTMLQGAGRIAVRAEDYLSVQRVLTDVSSDDELPSQFIYFVAEHIHSAPDREPGAAAASQTPRDAWFLPLNALGQWRAQAVWIQESTDASPEKLQATAADLLDLAITLDVELGRGLTQGVVKGLELALESNADSAYPYEAFTQLWAAQRAVFRRRPRNAGESPEVVEDVSSAASGNLTAIDSAIFDPPENSPEYSLSVHRMREGELVVALKLGATARELLEFDEVLFQCHCAPGSASCDEVGWSLLDGTQRPTQQKGNGRALLSMLRRQIERVQAHSYETSLSRALQCLGHHFSRTLDDAGVVEVGRRFERGEVLDATDWRRIAPRLWSIWSVGELVRALRSRSLPADWIEPQLLDETIDADELVRVAKGISMFYLGPRLDARSAPVPSSFAPDWQLRWSYGGQSVDHSFAEILEDFVSGEAELEALAPFANTPQQPGTNAVALGLAELIRNAANHLRACADRLRPILDAGEAGQPVIEIVASVSSEELELAVTNLAWDRRERALGETAATTAIREVMDLELSALARRGAQIVETTMPEVVETGDDWTRFRGTWTYRFGHAQHLGRLAVADDAEKS